MTEQEERLNRVVDRFNRVELADREARRRERLEDLATLAIVAGVLVMWWLARVAP